MKNKIQMFSQRLGHDISGVRPVMITDDNGDWVSRCTVEILTNRIDVMIKERDSLLSQISERQRILDNVVNVANKSEGIAGLYLDGKVAKWRDVLPEVYQEKS